MGRCTGTDAGDNQISRHSSLLPSSLVLKQGTLVDCLDKQGIWYQACVMQVVCKRQEDDSNAENAVPASTTATTTTAAAAAAAATTTATATLSSPWVAAVEPVVAMAIGDDDEGGYNHDIYGYGEEDNMTMRVAAEAGSGAASSECSGR